MTFTLNKIPGFTDLSDTPLTHDKVALGIHVASMSDNAALGTVRCEIFRAVYKDGDTVALPISDADGYAYSRDELIYMWGFYSTARADTNWLTGPDSLWWGAWKVDQNTGGVSCLEWYRRSGSHDNAQSSTDGQLMVWTIAQRQKASLTIGTAPTYSDQANTDFYQDAPYTQTMSRKLSHNSKFGVVSSEAIYMGEFYNGQTVPQPVSPADFHTYAYADVKFAFSWRWTSGQTKAGNPAMSLGQLGPISASINASTGVVTVQVIWVDNNGNLITSHLDGSIAVFAFCTRDPGSVSHSGSLDFAEISSDFFFPPNKLRASTVQRINKNNKFALARPEFFGPFTKANGDTISLPTSPIDGYTYSRSELVYMWEFSDTTPASGTHVRTAIISGYIDDVAGKVHLSVYRLPPGSHPVADDLTHSRINVVVAAFRSAVLPEVFTDTELDFGLPVMNSEGTTSGSSFQQAFWIKAANFSSEVSGLLQATLKGSTTLGDASLSRMCLKRTLAGSTVVLDTTEITFDNGSGSTTVTQGTTKSSDPLAYSFDPAHDYYILQSFSNGAGLAGATEPTNFKHSDVTLNNPGYLDDADISTHFSNFASPSDSRYLLSALKVLLTGVTPPSDGGAIADAPDFLVNGQ